MQITGFKVNDGHTAFTPFAGQNSQVVAACVEFDEEADLDPGALSLSLHTNNVSFAGVSKPQGMGAIPTCDLVCAGIPDFKKWYLIFQGFPNVEQAANALLSLKDGVYKLTVDGSKVQPHGGGTPMGGSAEFVFFRLFGKVSAIDQSGNNFTANVVSSDNLQMQNAIANSPNGYKIGLDADGSGANTSADLPKFTANFNKPLCWTV